jgi:hypothetical protein
MYGHMGKENDFYDYSKGRTIANQFPIFRKKIPHRRYLLMNQQGHSISIQQGVSLNNNNKNHS